MVDAGKWDVLLRVHLDWVIINAKAVSVREHNVWIHSDSPIANAKAKLLFDTLPTILWKTLVDYLFEV